MSPQSERCGNSALLRLQQTATRHAQPRRDAAGIRTARPRSESGTLPHSARPLSVNLKGAAIGVKGLRLTSCLKLARQAAGVIHILFSAVQKLLSGKT